MVTFAIALLLLWSPLVLSIFVVWGVNSTTSTFTLVILYGLFLGLAWVWASQVYGHSRPWQYYGLSWTPDNGLAFLGGLGLGGFVLLGLLGLELRLGWILWKPPAIAFLQVLVEGLIVAIAVGVTEEVLFRGWLLTELERDCAPGPAVAWSSLLFALLHFIRPLPEILRTWPRVFGLFLLGATLVWAKRCCGGNLGLAIGFHAGLVWGYYAIDVGQLISYSGAVPTWVTGINQNPLAGVMGLVWLGGLAWGFQRYALHHPD